jgi:hypothetical protein
MILSTGEQSSTRREQNAAVKEIRTRAAGSTGQPVIQEERGRYQGVQGNRNSRGSDEVQEEPGNRKLRSFGSGSRTHRETEADTEPSGEPGAPGNRSSGPAGPGNREQRATEVHEEPAARRSSNGRPELLAARRIEVAPGNRGCRRAETNFRKQRATEASTEIRETGVPGKIRETGDFKGRRAGSHRGTVTERAQGAGAQALRP